MSFVNLLMTSRKLGRVGRWANEYMTEDVRPTVASHLFTVSQIAQMLGLIEEENGNEVDWRSLYEKSLNHDFAESLTGDVLSHVKNHDKKIKNYIAQIEEKLVQENIINTLPNEYQDKYFKIIFNGKDETLEGQILKAADTIDMIIECYLEITRGNPEEIFKRSYTKGMSTLHKMKHIHSVKYFINHVLCHFTINEE